MPAGSAASSSGRIEIRRFAASAAALLAVALAAAGCIEAPPPAIADTYCRDTFFWRTSARDTDETRRQADIHNSRRLCKCDRDCP